MRAFLIATAIAAMLTSTAAIAQQSSQPMMGPQMPMMNQGMMGPNMMGHGMMGQGMTMRGQPETMMKLPDRLNWAEQHIAAHMEMLEAIKGTTEQLYAVLSDEQKRIADQLMGPMGMMGMM